MMEQEKHSPIAKRVFWLGLLLMILFLPLAFSASFYRSFETTKSSLLRVGTTLLLLIWSIIQLKEKDTRIFSLTPITRVMLLFLLSFSVSSLLSIEPCLSIFGIYDRQLGLIGALAVTCFCLLLMGGLKMEEGKESHVLKVMALSGSLASLYSLIQFFNLDPIAWSSFGNRPSSTLGHPDFLGGFLVLTIPLTLALGYLGRGWRLKIIWLLGLLVQFGGLLVSQTRGAWIAGVVSIITFFSLEPFFYRENHKLFRNKITISLISLSLLIGLGFSSLLLKPEFQHRALSILKFRDEARIYLWRDSFKVIKKYPIFGSGPETFRLAFMPYKSSELAKMERNVNYDNPHNNYLYLWATTGTLGLLTYLYLLFCCFRQGIKYFKKKGPSPTPPILYLGILTSLEAYAVFMLTGFDTLVTIFYLYVLIALLAAGESEGVKKFLVSSSTSISYGILLFSVILSYLTLYDSSRVLRADHLALNALESLERKPPHFLEARNLLKRSALILPRESFYRLQLGMAYVKIGQNEEEKKEAFRKAVIWGNRALVHSWAPENSYMLLSIAYLSLRDYPRAERVCRRALEIDPYNYFLRTNLALALSDLGKKQDALKEVDKALSIDPNYLLARELKEWLCR